MSGERAQASFRVRRELGIHARPAGQFVSIAGRFDCEIEVGRDGEWVSGNSVLSILSLAATQNTVLTVRAVGLDAEAAVAQLGQLIEAPNDDPVPA